MAKTKLDRNEIHLLAKHSDVNREQVEQLLQDDVFSSRESWNDFIRLALVVFGVSFTVLGILFFFAYNWEDLHRYVQIGIVSGLFIGMTVIAFYIKDTLYQKIVLTGSSVLVGVLLAVIGQIYQLGADSYQLFLTWTLLITIWVFILDFYPLWVLYIILFNVTYVTFTDQVEHSWTDMEMSCGLLFMNVVIFICFECRNYFLPGHHYPVWFSRLLALVNVCLATYVMCMGIDKGMSPLFGLILFMIILIYGYGMRYAFQMKNSFYLSILCLSIILTIAFFMVDKLDGDFKYLTICVFILISVSLVIRRILKWNQYE